MELLEAYQEYTTDITINKGMSQRTISSYCNDLKQYIAWLQKHDVMDTDDIQSTHIEDFLHEESAYKESTSISRMAASIRSFHSFLQYRIDAENPAEYVEVHHGEKKLPVFATKDEIDLLMASFDDQVPDDILHHAILEMIYSCGLRVSEAVSLTINRVNLETGFVRVLGKGNKERLVPIPDGAMDILKKWKDIVRPVYLEKKTNLFFINRFGRKVTARSVELLLNELFDLGICHSRMRHRADQHIHTAAPLVLLELFKIRLDHRIDVRIIINTGIIVDLFDHIQTTGCQKQNPEDQDHNIDRSTSAGSFPFCFCLCFRRHDSLRSLCLII